MEKHFLYIIYSPTFNKYYVGESQNPEQRLVLHNNHYFKKGFTKATNDWEFKLLFECADQVSARLLERFVKRMKSRVFIEKVIENKDILYEILKNKV